MNSVPVLPCDDATLESAAKILLGGGVVVIPTDTVYGLAAHPDFPDAVARLYTIKGRAEGKPIALLASSGEAAEKFLGAPLTPRAAALAKAHWPGALTMVLPKGSGFEGLRVPDHEWTRRLIEACGGTLRVTSANLSGHAPAVDAIASLASVGLNADMVCDDGVSPGGVASTVVKIGADDSLVVLRHGGVTVE